MGKTRGWMLAVMGLVAVAVCAFGYRARAQLIGPPSEMKSEDATEFDRDWTHITQIDTAAAEAKRPYVEKLVKLCKAYDIDPNQIGKTVGIDTETGKITRVGHDTKPPGPPPASSGAAPAVKK